MKFPRIVIKDAQLYAEIVQEADTIALKPCSRPRNHGVPRTGTAHLAAYQAIQGKLRESLIDLQ